MPEATVKIMNSYDYGHFEVSITTDNDTLEGIDTLRKDVQRLVDKAIKQYKVAKAHEHFLSTSEYGLRELKRNVKIIRENYPESEWTPEQMATVKELENLQYRRSIKYDYEDDSEKWESEEPLP